MQLPSVDGVEFRLIDGFPDYCVGNDGSVWSEKSGNWSKLRGERNNRMHLDVTLYSPTTTREVGIHVLVLESFVGPRPEGLLCRHLDGNGFNNHWLNLCWGTHVENEADKQRHGTTARGEGHGCSKLTEPMVHEIRRLCDQGVVQDRIAEMFGVTQVMVSYIKCRKFWSHI